MKHNFISSLFVIAGAMTALHYNAVIRVNPGCPMIIASGPPETGKSTAIKVALSLTGQITFIPVINAHILPIGLFGKVFLPGITTYACCSGVKIYTIYKN